LSAHRHLRADRPGAPRRSRSRLPSSVRRRPGGHAGGVLLQAVTGTPSADRPDGQGAAQTGSPASAAPHERWLVMAGITLLVVARSAVFVFWEQANFDSDQAVIGLMAKHLAELRAFPVFMYGQSYILAVEAWMAVPVFLIVGVSVWTLKLPLLAVNV